MASILPQRSAAAPDVLTVAREIRKALSVSRKDSTLVIMLTASAATPADAAAIANGLAAAYTEARADGRSDAARDASARLQDRLARLKADAEAKASEVEAYRARVIAMAAGGGVSTPEAPPPISSRDALKLRDLQRQADASLDVYNQYLAQSSDARAAGAPGAAALARIVSPAAPPQRPSSAPAWIWPLVGGAAACLMGLLLAALRTALDNRLVRPSDVQRKLGQEALVSIPTVNDSELRHFSPDERFPASLIVAKPMSRLAERMRMLLSRLAPLSINGHGLVVAVTSAVADEGKTTTALSLGRVASMGGQRVLMIEGDLRMRSLSELVGATSGGVDMIAALAGDTDWRSALFLDPATQAHILPVSTAFPMLGNTFASPRMLRILEEARAEYDLVILDCPPVLAIADARSLCSIADGTLVVSAWNDTPAPAVRAAIRAIQATGGGVIGVILNRLQPSLASRLSYGDALYEGPSSERYFAG
jgi:Mrp family chromosome partitioning ATPase